MPKVKYSAYCLMVLVMLVILPGCLKAENAEDPLSMARDTVRILRADGTEFLFHVEMAVTPPQREQGLMNRAALPDNAGMLFVFPREGKQVFWMKNTLIPLDMIFIARDGRINHIHHKARPLDETRITSDQAALAVLELNGGASVKFGLREGDKVLHEVFRNVNVQ